MYDIEEQELFEPFLGEESYTYSDSDESDEETTSQHGLKTPMDKGKGKIDDTLKEVLEDSMQSQNKPTEGPKKPHKATYKPRTQQKKPIVEVGT